MNIAKPLERKNFEEFETMTKEEGWNYELTEQKSPECALLSEIRIQGFSFINRDDRIRTCGLLLPKQSRYQAALHPDTNRR